MVSFNLYWFIFFTHSCQSNNPQGENSREVDVTRNGGAGGCMLGGSEEDLCLPVRSRVPGFQPGEPWAIPGRPDGWTAERWETMKRGIKNSERERCSQTFVYHKCVCCSVMAKCMCPLMHCKQRWAMFLINSVCRAAGSHGHCGTDSTMLNFMQIRGENAKQRPINEKVLNSFSTTNKIMRLLCFHCYTVGGAVVHLLKQCCYFWIYRCCFHLIYCMFMYS